MFIRLLMLNLEVLISPLATEDLDTIHIDNLHCQINGFWLIFGLTQPEITSLLPLIAVL